MKGQNIKKYEQKEVNFMFKTDKKTRNYTISLPHDKMLDTSRENQICENELLLTSGNKMKPNTTQFPFLYLAVNI